MGFNAIYGHVPDKRGPLVMPSPAPWQVNVATLIWLLKNRNGHQSDHESREPARFGRKSTQIAN